MSLWQAIALGLIQGLTEFLPVSSSAHLSLTPWLFGFEDPGLAFDVALHMGTLVAVLWYFRKEWLALVDAGWSIVRHRRVETVAERRAVYLVIATIPGGLAGLFLGDLAETAFRAPVITAVALAALGTLLWAADKWAPRRRGLDEMRWTDALWIGCAQMFALVPGVSRSGSTITAARALGLDRQSAAVFSFLMSMPITAAAGAAKVPEALASFGWSVPLVAGIIAAGISSWLAITVLLRFVSRYSYGVFAAYRWGLALVVLYVFYARG